MAKLDWDKASRRDAARRSEDRTKVLAAPKGKKAKFSTTCARCRMPISEGERIRQWVGRWVHTTCSVPRQALDR